MNWPPTTMATQHPDNASVPWWKKDAFISTQEEIQELLLMFQELGIDEYMWDWEGKYVDESVGEKLYSTASEFLSANPLGDRFHFTFRIPAFDGDKLHRMARAFMNVLSLADLAHDLKLPRPPVTEMFLPLTTSADQLKQVCEKFKEVAQYHRSVFHLSKADELGITDLIEVTPLVEDVESMFGIADIVRPYWQWRLENGKDMTARGQRIFLARSDPALNAGLVPAVLAIKSALSEVNEIGAELGIAVHPLLGTGSLPFRGSVNPLYTDTFLEQYAGTRTYSIQSAFRYDYEREKVDEALQKIKTEAPKLVAHPVSAEDRATLAEIASVFSAIWKPTVEALADRINAVAAFVPARRERLLHVGLFGYSRGIGAVKLPRAIKFTAAFYSLGVPPELVSTGRALKEIAKRGQLELLEKFYPALRTDLLHAGKHLNRENLALLAERDATFTGIQEDVEGIESVLGIELVHEKPRHVLHRNLTSNVYQRLHCDDLHDEQRITANIVQAGIIRRSLG